MRKTRLRKSMVFGVATMLAACVSAPSAPRPVSSDPSYLEFWQALCDQPASGVAAIANAYATQTDPGSRLRHAMALAAPNYAQHDEVRAQQLAESVMQAPDASVATREAAAWFVVLLGEARKNEQALRRAQADAKHVEQLEARVRDSERRAADAEYKLGALKQIERDMVQRPSGVGVRP